MCNMHKLKTPIGEIDDLFQRLSRPLSFPESRPNLEPKDQICITDRAPILCAGPALVVRPWSWKGPNGAPVFNFRSEGRRFAVGSRCAIPTDGFYEFTTPEDPKQKKKDRWLFTLAGEGVFFIAGVMRDEAWSMLTVEPGPDVAPFHNRQVVVMGAQAALDWLDGAAEADVLRPSPAGTLAAERG